DPSHGSGTSAGPSETIHGTMAPATIAQMAIQTHDGPTENTWGCSMVVLVAVLLDLSERTSPSVGLLLSESMAHLVDSLVFRMPPCIQSSPLRLGRSCLGGRGVTSRQVLYEIPTP